MLLLGINAWICSLHVCGIAKVRSHASWKSGRYAIESSQPDTNSDRNSSSQDEYGKMRTKMTCREQGLGPAYEPESWSLIRKLNPSKQNLAF